VLFLSHASGDREVAGWVHERLRAEGFTALFLDFDPEQGIPPGRDWEQDLYAQLRKCDGLIFLASSTSVRSAWCFAEVALARSLSRPVFPLVLEPNVNLPLLADVQRVDLEADGSGIARLVAGLRAAGLDARAGFAWDGQRSPYPGLAAFDIATRRCSSDGPPRPSTSSSCCSRRCSRDGTASSPSSAPRAAGSRRCCAPACCRGCSSHPAVGQPEPQRGRMGTVRAWPALPADLPRPAARRRCTAGRGRRSIPGVREHGGTYGR
jgi:hypothetical protein